jgi:hypothetical protein
MLSHVCKLVDTVLVRSDPNWYDALPVRNSWKSSRRFIVYKYTVSTNNAFSNDLEVQRL